jgi:hypothetical protein
MSSEIPERKAVSTIEKRAACTGVEEAWEARQ